MADQIRNPYSFEAFLDWRRSVDYYRDDSFLRHVVRCYCGDEADRLDQVASELSPLVSNRWRDLAESAARPEKRPFILHYDGHGNRIDRIVRPLETEIMEREVFARRLFSRQTTPWARLLQLFLIYQNGEACIACPLTCTEGMVELLRRFAETPELTRILEHCGEGFDGHVAIGAQYLSEIQAGSDIPANLVEARPEGDHWRIHGQKFFCSATHADYALVTAKPQGTATIGLFIVPSWLPGDKIRERRNGTTIDRIKWKLGTSELTTAEITFDGALAYQVGPLERGLANAVGIVLTYSRLTVALSAAASMVRAAREAESYSRFRIAFGQPIASFPAVAAQVARLERFARRSLAGTFKLYGMIQSVPGGVGGSLRGLGESDRRVAFAIRELIMLQKITTAQDSTDMLRLAISIFGGHGVMEDFSALPRLLRDSVVNELWEGPRNVLLDQVLRDIRAAADWFPPADLVGLVLAGADPGSVERLAAEMADLATDRSTTSPDIAAMAFAEHWDDFCHRLFHAFQEQACRQVEEFRSPR